MEFTQRQKDILETVVEEYIRLAQPISSQLLEERYDFGVSPATIRNEMLALSEQGFLMQPHTASGRVPTDKGYRFFVDEILREPKQKEQEHMFEELGDVFEEAGMIAKNLAGLASVLTAVYLEKKGMLFKEGWEELLEEPEFDNRSTVKNFAKLVEEFEERAGEFPQGSGIQVFIGREAPFSNAKEFSIMIADFSFPEGEKGKVALLGPKRMAYHKNIRLLESLL
ncbi:MAG: hypothetical protein A3A27_00745 [Candidatus Wildermuthbacteria bacterium RIFCSPLOWO2_01_FULL_47_18]|uniref:Heat-inducible transcription repressor HrcA n=2 Tax=Candidatus Wildermuthiibacteriota TaxID=1817923 RepID=A0A1G2RJH3_9BACT|nr:MAG: hypothetical protein A3J68_00750 [Candidatus Wildermuthbacteria bacterium RIFCSPHIGHO2_02_FULL_48_16]OHA72993.1 MAG: hypothetical protein A3A27_00745 [Candidatus Wildermuthbacteria bacterium RIFCSPLOWO2_01_FULL_47_18]OHB18331.1 MAG: hypothetical protein A2749_02120 [Parcubacteria group bacterium RIFCSPHIGHO2_01_FULL_45_26]